MKSLKSDGQQLHQYQQNKQLSSLQIIERNKYHEIWHLKSGPGLGQAQKCGGFKPVKCILPHPLLGKFYLQRHYR
jgi:hypothetical protein